MLLIFLGVIAGIMTTLSGFGGGMIMVVVLSLVWNPVAALSVSAMALLVGNSHRLLLFRRFIDWRIVRLLLLGLVPGAAAGAMVAVAVPAVVLHVLILLMVALALLRRRFPGRWRIPTGALAPSGAVIGAVGATSGGAGPLMGALLLSVGLGGDAYIATLTTAGISMQIGRLAGYGLSGAMHTGMIATALMLAGALMAGNWLGKAMRAHLDQARLAWLEYAAPVICAVVAVIGLGA